MLTVAMMLSVVVATCSALLTKYLPVGVFDGLFECGIVVVRCGTVWLWGCIVERSGCGFIAVGDVGRRRERA